MTKKWLVLAGLAFAGPLAAQQSATPLFVEGRGGVVVPTFDIAKVVTTGGAFGATVGYWATPRWVVMGEFDYGKLGGKPAGAPDVTTLHYVGKIGYSVTGPRDRGWDALVNLGAGAVSFRVDGVPPTHTYFAINAGAKIAYNLNRSLALVLSPQGDIAFSKKSELTTTNAWVWPVTAGVRVKL